MKIFFRYYLLCDGCNWEFTGFAVPGTVTSTPKRSKKKAKSNSYEQLPKTVENKSISELKENNIDKTNIKANL